MDERVEPIEAGVAPFLLRLLAQGSPLIGGCAISTCSTWR